MAGNFDFGAQPFVNVRANRQPGHEAILKINLRIHARRGT
jgi:hypothetical protein